MQGFNMGRYVPPDLEGVASFNQASGTKPTRKAADGSTVVRFECPFAIWCTNCSPEAIIGQGVRFNAHKKQVGNYYSTPIWSFRIKHTVCGEWIDVHTDPKNADYVVVSGGRKRDTGIGVKGDWFDEDRLEISTGPKKEQIDAVENGFAKLEKANEDKSAAEREKTRVHDLRKRSERDWKDPYAANKRIRDDFRVGRRQRQKDEKTGEALQDRYGLGVDLVTPSMQDMERAKLVDFRAKDKPANPGRGTDSSRATGKSKLASMLKDNVKKKYDPFKSEYKRAWLSDDSATAIQAARQHDKQNPANYSEVASSLVNYESD